MMWDAKRPEERDVFAVDLSRRLRLPDGTQEAIATVVWTVPAGLVLHGTEVAGAVAMADISGGVAGTTYDIDVAVQTNGLRQLLIRVRLPVRAA